MKIEDIKKEIEGLNQKQAYDYDKRLTITTYKGRTEEVTFTVKRNYDKEKRSDYL